MRKDNFSQIANRVLQEQLDEKKIREYKEFYKKHLSVIKDKENILHQLNSLFGSFLTYKVGSIFNYDPIKAGLETNAEKLIEKNFSKEVVEIFNKKIVKRKPDSQKVDNNPLWAQMLIEIALISKKIDENHLEQWRYKIRVLAFLKSCLYYNGLNPLIKNRNPQIYKRYSFIIEHDFKSKVLQKEHKVLITLEKLETELLSLYEQKAPILINGKLIPHKNICRLKIFSTLLLDDEIELFAERCNFFWNNSRKDEIAFINNCLDETDKILRNPFLIKKELNYMANYGHFVHPNRIRELEIIKSEKFDLIKLIQLCKELNTAAAGANFYSSSSLVRNIIDHVPPIFGFKNFSEVANNYKEGGRSFKKLMLSLDTSARNIADSNIHLQVRQKEILPTNLQTDFTRELDCLLGEVIRILK
jgi:hypothetical protein